MTVSASDIVGWIGAGAWLPQIFGWLWRAASKPKLRVRAGGNVQVGFSGVAGVVALNVAVSCERKDALVDDMQAVLSHEHGDTRRFSWNMASETQAEMRNDVGERLQWSRTQTVLALKVSTQALAERFLGFNLAVDEAAILASQTAAKTEWESQKSKGAVDWNIFVREPIAQAVRKEVEQAFHWQEGRYRIALQFSIVGGGAHREQFEFNLSRADVERLRENLALWDKGLQAHISDGTWPSWVFCFPRLVRKT